MTAIRYVRGTLPGLPGEHDIAILEGDTHISRWVEESRRLDHDQNALPVVGKLIGPESVVYDVGSFIGDHSCYYASIAKRVYAFEADYDAGQALCENLRLYPNATVMHWAVGDGSPVESRLFEMPNKGARWMKYNPMGLPSRKLDDLWSDVLPPTLIKLDIEGWEVRALRGAERTLRAHRPTLVVEVNRGALERAGTSPEELHALLTGYGYQMWDLFTEELWLPGDTRPQFDVVGLPK